MSFRIYPDNPAVVMKYADQYPGGRALVILGGPSGIRWSQVAEEINPDVILTANGNTRTPGVGFWMLAENMHHQAGRAEKGDPRALEFMSILNGPNTAEVRLVSHWSFGLLQDTENAISIKRRGRELNELENFTMRDYGEGYLWGWMMRHVGALRPRVKTHVGTVALPLIHHAGILGVDEIHTIGLDLNLGIEDLNTPTPGGPLSSSTPTPGGHHWYKYPDYEADRFSAPAMFTVRQYGEIKVSTRWDMIESMEYMKELERREIFAREGITWRDHSRGLLWFEGLQCTK